MASDSVSSPSIELEPFIDEGWSPSANGDTVRNSTSLCSFCKQFSLHYLSRQPDHASSRKLLAVEKGARDHCTFCVFLLSQLQQDLLQFTVHPSESWLRIRIPTAEGRPVGSSADRGLQLHEFEVYLASGMYETKLEQRSRGIFLGLAAESNSPAAESGDIAGRYHGNDLTSTAHIEAARKWLDSCSEHPQCKSTASGSTKIDDSNTALPTRCIEIGQNNILLVETANLHGSYATLTHRWQHETTISKTTAVNYDQRRRGQGFENLPKSFRDAMAFSRYLGVRYIWIDSLCIIQADDNDNDNDNDKSTDATADWAKEAGKMAQYYQNSKFTIAIVGESPAGGILGKRTKSPFHGLTRLPYITKGRSRLGWYYVYNPTRRSLDSFIDNIRNSELLSRGWVFQEWFLSRRIFFFCPDEVFFECQSALPLNERQQTLLVNSKNDLALQIKEQLQGKSDFRTWYSFIELYSNTELSESAKDYLMAMSGIAAEFGEKLKAIGNAADFRERLKALGGAKRQVHLEYLSGLWLEDLHYGMLWQTRSAKTKSCECGAPSWSWASRLGRVRWLTRASKANAAFTPVTLFSRSGSSYKISDHDKWPPKKPAQAASLGPNCSNSSSQTNFNPFSTTSLITKLALEGSIQPLLIRLNREVHGHGRTAVLTMPLDTVAILGRETEVALPKEWEWADWKHNINAQRTPDWYLVCFPQTPTVIGGWVLFDDPEYEKQLNGSEGTILPALHVLTRVRAGLQHVEWRDRIGSMVRNIAEVLILDPLGENRYRRLGVGRIYDENALKAFKADEKQLIELV